MFGAQGVDEERREVVKLARGSEQTLGTMLGNTYFICGHINIEEIIKQGRDIIRLSFRNIMLIAG